MKKISYCTSPSLLYKNKHFLELTILEKGIYFEITNYIWNSEEQFRIKYDIEEIGRSINCEAKDVENVIQKLQNGDDKIFAQELDFDNFEFFLHHIDLKKQIENFKNEKQAKQFSDNNLDLNKKMLTTRIANKEKVKSPRIGYLQEKERKLASYNGWLPTNKFGTSGEIYIVTESYIKSISQGFDNINIKDELEQMFNWLSNNRTKRKWASKMEDFIYNWLKSSEQKSSIKEEEFNELLDNAFEMVDF